jgi:two-component system, OmpR family, sensor kinase
VKTLALHTRLTAGFAALLIALALVLVVAIAWVAERYRAEMTQRLNAGIAMYVTNELKLVNASGIDRRALAELAGRAMTLNPSAEVYLLGVDGALLASLTPPEKVLRNRVALAPVYEFLSDSERRPLYGDDPTSRTRSGVFSVARLQVDGRLAGYLYVVLASNRFSSVIAAVRSNYSLQVAMLTAVAILIVTVGVAAMLFRHLTLPLRRLSSDMRQWSIHMEIPAGEASDQADEIRSLAAQFRILAARISAQKMTIAARDGERRELIANVSHDLRTPLASLHGYLETVLLKADQITQTERAEYLQTARRHSRQIARLIDSLLELSRLESGLVEPLKESFCVSELINDVVQRFQLRALQQAVVLTAETDHAAMPVCADLALVERVLSNLIDNALRHTPREGWIRVTTRSADNHVITAVEDSGSGIAAADLPHVFDRYYHGRDRHQGSSGLGLAIARRIVELHGQRIEIFSGPGCGTRVEFGLPPGAEPWAGTMPVSQTQ